MFDREGDDGKFVSVTIKATDQGEPSLEGVCSFTGNYIMNCELQISCIRAKRILYKYILFCRKEGIEQKN